MMQSGNNNQDRIDEVMDSLDGIQPAMPRPFLYTRIMARMERTRKDPWVRTWDFLTRPAVSLAIVFSLMIINLYILFQRSTSQPELKDEPTANLSNDYESQFVSYYSFNEEQP
jgi:hypothetical protein